MTRGKYKGAPAPVRLRTPAGLDVTRTLQPGDYVEILRVDRVAHVRPDGWPNVGVVVPAATVHQVAVDPADDGAHVLLSHRNGRVHIEIGEGLDRVAVDVAPEAARTIAEALALRATEAEEEPAPTAGEAAEA